MQLSLGDEIYVITVPPYAHEFLLLHTHILENVNSPIDTKKIKIAKQPMIAQTETLCRVTC